MSLSLEGEPGQLRQLLERINTIPRTGWLKSGVPLEKCETVGQHTARMLAIVQEYVASWTKVSVETSE
jgi:5'-deoxynucleotidase YfbR-like HD superfamily hydrolase